MFLNSLSNINQQTKSIMYMDRSGRQGYLARTFKYDSVLVAHFVKSLYIPETLLALDDLRDILQYIYDWRNCMIRLGNEVKLAVYQEKRRYIVAGVGLSHHVVSSPPKSPRQMEIIIPFFTPNKQAN